MTVSTFKVGHIPVIETDTTPISDPRSLYTRAGPEPRTVTLPVGFKKEPDCRAIERETIFEQDVAIPMRDGVVLRADVFRPAGAGARELPAIVHYSPYGKTGTGAFDVAFIPGRVGIARSHVSGYQSFEAFDPIEWVLHDYAVVNVDARGTYGSEGNIKFWGTAEGRDGHDVIEHIAQLPWCSGKVALTGNSWLTMTQWFIAAERPPHLACMMPLEGVSDLYRENLLRGGVPYPAFFGLLGSWLFGNTQREDIAAMIAKYPFMNDYWEDKRANISLIQVPAYVLASMSTMLHTVGSLRGFEEIPHDKKWLRIHSTHEWHDLYQKHSIADFKKFLDFYMKGHTSNGWEATPKVRASVIRYNADPIPNLEFTAWPIPEAKDTKLYLSADNTLLQSSSSVVPGQQSYQSDAKGLFFDADGEELSFTYVFPKQTRLIGTTKAVLYMSCPDYDDLDVFVILRKADKNGKVLRHLNVPFAELKAAAAVGDGMDTAESVDDVPLINPLQYIGPSGILRASHRAIDESKSKHNFPVHKHTEESQEKITPGQVVKLEIGIWPAGIQFEAGERLVLRISGHDMRLPEFDSLRGVFEKTNKGRHIVHVGGEYDSHIILPLLQV
ncbi:Alpha/Beta hydrolase protein [Paraphoma chrysanthemicola]|nr:Alpha/Beta hydrolase protein [Paraphoma chrysanthemicola]